MKGIRDCPPTGVNYDGLWWGPKQRYLNNYKLGYLHRYIWKKYVGDIPEGWVVHHKDHDTYNNELSNLECMSSTDHRLYHNRLFSVGAKQKMSIAKARENHPLWGTHRSEETKKKISESNKRFRLQKS